MPPLEPRRYPYYLNRSMGLQQLPLRLSNPTIYAASVHFTHCRRDSSCYYYPHLTLWSRDIQKELSSSPETSTVPRTAVTFHLLRLLASRQAQLESEFSLFSACRQDPLKFAAWQSRPYPRTFTEPPWTGWTTTFRLLASSAVLKLSSHPYPL